MDLLFKFELLNFVFSQKLINSRPCQDLNRICLWEDTQADLVIEIYANYKDQLGLGYSMLQITLYFN